MDDGIFPPPLFRPWSGNDLRGRADVETALRSLCLPVERYRSPGGARIRLDSAAAHFDQASADLEGFARLLWGLAPAAAGGADWIDWEPIVCGLANGTDPAHPEYWGQPFARSQRLVEAAAIGFALRLVPDRLWDPLPARARDNVSRWLQMAHACDHAENNWKFFRLMVGMGLRHVGIECDRTAEERYASELDGFYLGDGWYRDGGSRRADHYIPFAFHYYGLILAALDAGAWTERYRERAGLIARDITRWFADDGAAICFGRSMTYRFAITGFLGALGVAGDPVIPCDELKGHYLRSLRWWAKQPMASRDGVLPVGYGYSNPLMAETYNSGQSPYWALKAFLPLMLPETDPFWAGEESGCPPREHVSVQRHPGFVVANPPGDAIALSSGQQTWHQDSFIRFGPQKYAKFAYSARYGFSIESDPPRFADALVDNMIGFSDDGLFLRVRESNEIAMIADGTLFARWWPYQDVRVETWLYWEGEFHVRIHRIDTPRPLAAVEGGFAIARGAGERCEERAGAALAATDADLSAVFDLGSSIARRGQVRIAAPNTNLIAPRTLVPQLQGDLPAGESTLAVAVVAGGDPASSRAAIGRLPPRPDVEALRRLVADRGIPVSLMSVEPGRRPG